MLPTVRVNLISAGLAAIARAGQAASGEARSESSASKSGGEAVGRASRVYSSNANGTQITLKVPHEEVEGQSLNCLL